MRRVRKLGRFGWSLTCAAVFPCVPMLAAQSCPDLTTEPAPVAETCAAKGLTAFFKNSSCRGRNEQVQTSFTRRTRGFASGLDYSSQYSLFSTMDDQAEYVTVDSLRGCRGENINIVIKPGTISFIEYQLSAPNDAVIAEGRYSNWRGDQILGRNVTLPQSGYYVLKTRTQAPAKSTTRKGKGGAVENVVSYPRTFSVAFRTDAGVAPLAVGDKIDATVTTTMPFIRKVTVAGGSKVRFRFATLGTGNMIASVLRQTGEQLHQSRTPVAFDEVLAVTPGSDEVFTVRVEPAPGVPTVGLQFTVIDDKAAGATITMGNVVQSAFKLPAQYDYTNNPNHRAIYATEMTRLVYQSAGAERIALLVKPSGASGLAVRVRVYDQATEDVIADEVLTKPGTVSAALARAGAWVIAIAPMSASELVQAGEAKYTVELRSASGAAPARRPAARAGRP